MEKLRKSGLWYVKIFEHLPREVKPPIPKPWKRGWLQTHPTPFAWWRYLLASDEQTGDPEQLEAVCSYRGREEKTVQSIHGQAQ